MVFLNETYSSTFSRISRRPFIIMDRCRKYCEIKTVSLTCGLLQVLPWNNDTIIEKWMAVNDATI